MSMIEFPESVIEKIGYYVYLLRDPETNDVFYVGKGSGNRIFAHVRATIKNPDDSLKIAKIKDILEKGLLVKHEILRHGLTEKEAFEVEAAMIDYLGLPLLTNRVHGYEAFERGRMSSEELVINYGAKPINITEPAILIIINRLFDRNASAEHLYEVTRGNWVVAPHRHQVKYAVAVYRGIVRQVYQIHSWSKTKARTAEQRTQNRWRFDGIVATNLSHYIGGSVKHYLKTGSQNPIRYLNCD